MRAGFGLRLIHLTASSVGELDAAFVDIALRGGVGVV